MVRCSVIGCKSDGERKVSNLSFHSFPENIDLRLLWIEATGRKDWEPKIFSRICSKHFHRNLFMKKKQRTYLFPYAVPMLACTIHSKEKQHIENDEFIREIQISTNTTVECKLARDDSGALPTGVIEDTSFQKTEGTLPPYTPRTMQRKLHSITQQSTNRLKKLRALREKSRRLTKKVAKLENVIAGLKAKSLVSDEEGDMLESIDSVNKDFLKKVLCPGANGKKYSPSLRKFALCLNFISPRAYRYVRECFNTCLPHPSTLNSWYRSIDANPGFTTESLDCIKLLANCKDKPLYCALSMDEMAIRKHVQWDGEKCVGLVNYGEALDGHNVAEARQALVFMATSINDGWKIPVGYFFIDGCNGEQKANLVSQCIRLLIDCGINVMTLTFDGCPSNFKMAQKLGCRFDQAENIKPYFEVGGYVIFIIPDPAHMLKLVRNTLGQKKELVSACGEKILWQYIEKLHNLQENEGLHLANRLKRHHIDFSKQIMKVKLAAQTFSNSVAIAIKFCHHELHLPDFSGSDATVDFITKINNLFDVLNSRNLVAYEFKKPINKENWNKIHGFLTEIETYIKGLHLEGRNILTSNRKVGFLGLLICIQSLKKMFSDYISTGKLNFLPVYKLSQDHLECFFSSIRSKGGFNNNPTAFQFQSAYKKLVLHGEIKSITSGNCIPLEDIKILTHTEMRYEKKINVFTKNTSEVDKIVEDTTNTSSDHDAISDHDYLADPSRLSIYAEEIIPYIGGFVVRKLLKSIKYEDCLLALVSDKYSGLILNRDKGGLIYPSHSVIKICMLAEKIFKKNVIRGLSFFADKNLMPKLISSTLKSHSCQSLFTEDHFNNQPLIGNHRILLIKAITARYFEIRIHHATKKFEPQYKIRNFSNKLVLFKGQ